MINQLIQILQILIEILDKENQPKCYLQLHKLQLEEILSQNIKYQK
jgi:hypothetical protein